MTTLQTASEVICASWHTNKRPVLLLGEPGVGKTAAAIQAAKQLGVPYIFISCSTARPEDCFAPNFMGVSSNGTFGMAVNNVWPIEGNDATPDECIVILDELSQASTDVQTGFGQALPPNSKLGEFTMKPGVMFVATGNRRQDKAGAKTLLTHMMNRFTVLDDVAPTLREWLRYGRASQYDHRVMSFHASSEGTHIGFNPNNPVNPTFRAWSDVSEFMKRDDNISPQALQAIVTGIVSEGPAAQFLAWVQIGQELPNADHILASAKFAASFDPPSAIYHPAKAWYLASSLSAKVTYDNADNYLTAILKVCNGAEDMLVACLQAAKASDWTDSGAFKAAILDGPLKSLRDQI